MVSLWLGLLILAIVLIALPEATGKFAGVARFGWIIGIVAIVLLLVRVAGLR